MTRRHLGSHRIVCWRLTRRCNRACSFCLSESNPQIAHPIRRDNNLLARMARLGVRKISYSGGEPSLYPTIATIVRTAESMGFEQVLTTNGDASPSIYDAWMRRLQYLKISFYGYRHAHDRVMGHGHYDKLMALAQELVRKGGRVGANLLLVSSAVDNIRNMLLDAASRQLSGVLVMSYIRSQVKNVDRRFDPLLASRELCALIEANRDVIHEFPDGVKLHYYADDHFYVVLDENGFLTLPEGSRSNMFRMGHIDSGFLRLPWVDAPLPADQALECVWHKRRGTSNIVTFT